MLNLNPGFIGKFDQSSDLLGYIDEAGDEGFNFSSACTKWFAVGGIILTPNESTNMSNSLSTCAAKHFRTKSQNNWSFKDLTHQQRKSVLGSLAKHTYLGFGSVFHKPDIEPNDPLCTYPSMYFVGIKNVIERMSWAAAQLNKRRVHIMISTRNGIAAVNLKTYLFTNSIIAKRNLSYQDKIGVVSLGTPQVNPRLLFADYAASSLFQCLEKTSEANIPDTIFSDIYLKGRMYRSSHTGHEGVWSNGVKCTPGDKTLIEYGGILEEGSHNA